MNKDNLIKCNRCEGDACYTQKIGKITLYSCYGCGFQTSTVMKKGENFLKNKWIYFLTYIKLYWVKIVKD